MSWKDEIKKQPEPKHKFRGGSAECKQCKNFFSYATRESSQEVKDNYKSMMQTGMCKKCLDKRIERSKDTTTEWPIDRFGNMKGQWPSRSKFKN